MERRELFQIMGAAAFQPQIPYTSKFFTPAESQSVTRLAEIIMPGSQKAGVIKFIDLVVKYGDETQQRTWREGLAAVEADSQTRFSKSLAKISAAELDKVVAGMAENEGRRTDLLGCFFVTFKRLTVEAYHYSATHWRDNMHRGVTTAVANFPGCDHKGHKS